MSTEVLTLDSALDSIRTNCGNETYEKIRHHLQQQMDAITKLEQELEYLNIENAITKLEQELEYLNIEIEQMSIRSKRRRNQDEWE